MSALGLLIFLAFLYGGVRLLRYTVREITLQRAHEAQLRAAAASSARRLHQAAEQTRQEMRALGEQRR
jgi:hypothetical protein